MKINNSFIATYLKLSLSIISFLFLLVYIIIALKRMQYPYELEWMEGGSVDHVLRVLSHKELYIEPSLEFTPYTYTPLYYYISAVLSSIIGIGFYPLRLVSFISSIICLYLIFLFVKSETGNSYSGYLSACLFAATFKIGGAWFDIGRVDSLFLALFLLGIYFIRFKPYPITYALSGILLSLSYLTKQTAIVMTIPIILFIFVANRYLSLYLLSSYLLIFLGSTLILNYNSNGWFAYYIFSLPMQHDFVKSVFISFWIINLIKPLSISIIFIMIYLIRDNYRIDEWKGKGFYIAMLIGMVGVAFISILKSGGYNNGLLPTYAAISILLGLSVDYLFNEVNELPYNINLSLSFIYIAIIFQFLTLSYDPRKQIPNKMDREAGEEFIQFLKQKEGEVFIPGHGYLSILAGKKTYAQSVAIMDVLRGQSKTPKQLIKMEIEDSIKNQRFSAIIIDSEDEYLPEIDKYYVNIGDVFAKDNVFYTVTGKITRPKWVFIPRKINVNSLGY